MNRSTRFRFSLRTLFVVVTVVGICLGWLLVQFRWIRDRREALDWIGGHGGYATSNVGSDPTYTGLRTSNSNHSIKGLAPHVDAPWSLRLFREVGISVIVIFDSDGKDSEFLNTKGREFERLFPEADVRVVP